MARSAIVLAAGLGTRMKSKQHKVLHTVCGKPMILHILDELEKLHLDQLIVVVGQQHEAVSAIVGSRAQIAYQEQQLGTGHAVQVAVPLLESDIQSTVVLYGDAPLIRAETISELLSERERRQASAVALTASVSNPSGLGRVIMGDSGIIERVVEEKDASPEEKQISVINTGIYAFQTNDLIESLKELRTDNAQGEYYLTDTLGILRKADRAVFAHEVADVDEVASVNDRAQLSEVEHLLRRRICSHWMREGVTIVDPSHTYIGMEVTLERDTVLLPGTVLEGRTHIGEDCVIGPNCRLVDARIADHTTVEYSVVLQSQVGAHASVGPFAYLRPGSTIGSRVKIGDFVEVKNSSIGDDTKVSHLAYVGDADIGQRVNMSCGAITVNYDGRKKHRTAVGDDSFVGCNVNLVAPVTVGDGAYLCAGSTITDDVPSDGFAIARERQVTKQEYVRAWQQKRFEK